MNDMNEVLKVEHLSHVYSAGTPFEKKAVDDVSFTARKGEFIGLIGHTGSGKSTLIQHFNGLLKPTSGRVLINGEDIFQSKEMTRAARFAVGLVFQYPEYQLFEGTVYADVAFGPKNMGLDKDEIDRRVRENCRIVGLPEEALDNVDKYLDDCMMAGLSEVSIVHGKGTGVLRNEIGQHLRKHPHVAEFRLGRYGEGETGVTIVTLK